MELNRESLFTISPEPRYENGIILHVIYPLESYSQPYLYHSHLTTTCDTDIGISYWQASPKCCKWKEIIQFTACFAFQLNEKTVFFRSRI